MSAPLVLLHGFLGCAADWDPVVPALACDRACLAPDLPGHGSDPVPVGSEDEAFPRTVAWLAACIEEQDGGPCDVVGYSMGGRLLLGLLCARPELVRRAVAVGAAPGPEDEEDGARAARLELDAVRAAALRSLPFEVWLQAWYAAPLFDTLRHHPDFPAVRARRLRGRPEALAAALEALSPGRQPALRQRLATCPVPALLVAGSQDTKYATLGRELADANPAFEAVTVPHAGHAPQLEQPDEFVRAVRTFLDRP